MKVWGRQDERQPGRVSLSQIFFSQDMTSGCYGSIEIFVYSRPTEVEYLLLLLFGCLHSGISNRIAQRGNKEASGYKIYWKYDV